jgi:hypothetical protein
MDGQHVRRRCLPGVYPKWMDLRALYKFQRTAAELLPMQNYCSDPVLAPINKFVQKCFLETNCT